MSEKESDGNTNIITADSAGRRPLTPPEEEDERPALSEMMDKMRMDG